LLAIGCGGQRLQLIADNAGLDSGSSSEAATSPDAAIGSQTGPGSDAGAGFDAGAGSDEHGTAVLIGGTVVGLVGKGLVLENNGGDDIAVDANGVFVFPTRLGSETTYSVTVKTQPTAPSQTCLVSAGTGTAGTSDVTNVVVNCTSSTFTVQGTVSGLMGTGLLLQNNAGDDISGANGMFTFPKPLPDGSDYLVTVARQPVNPPQTCTVGHASGKIAGANITNVAIVCATNNFTIGGHVTGLSGTLVLTNNGVDDKTITMDGPFTFATPIASGGQYAVAVKTQPGCFHCDVTGGSGPVSDQNIAGVQVTCSSTTLGTTVFNFTGAEQTIVVPPCAVAATITAVGAQGGNAIVGGVGGLGGVAQGDLAVTPGTVLHVFVGGQNGYNGGGPGGQTGNTTGGGLPAGLAASGGGASDVRVNGTLLTDRVIVAGGGGGAGDNGDWPTCQTAGPAGDGGAGGALAGLSGTAGVGTPCNCQGGGGAGGQGGTQVAGGGHGGYAGNTACLRSDWMAGIDGSLGQGGSGSLAFHNGTGGGGGGGGGYFGGGAGGNGSDTTPGGGGGGGSSFVGALTNASTSAALRSGNGNVTILFK
jgi:hypothetical protein